MHTISPTCVTLKKVFHGKEEVKSPPVVNCTVLNPKAPEWTQPQAANPACSVWPIYSKVPVASDSSFESSTKIPATAEHITAAAN